MIDERLQAAQECTFESRLSRGRALGYFQRALKVDPANEQTQAMVAKLTSLGIVPVDEDGSIDISNSQDTTQDDSSS